MAWSHGAVVFMPAILALTAAYVPHPVQSWLFSEITGSYYYMSDNDMYYSEAVCYCKHLGGTLTKIETSEELVVLNSFLENYTLPLWVGASDLREDGHYVWEDGTSVLDVLWTPKQPSNDPNEDYVQIVKPVWLPQDNFTLNDAIDHPAKSICERSPGAQRKAKMWTEVARDKIHPDHVIEHVTDAGSLVGCLVYCEELCGCYSVVYHADHHTCDLYNSYHSRLNGTVVECPGCLLYE